jgi:hypothetical protein
MTKGSGRISSKGGLSRRKEGRLRNPFYRRTEHHLLPGHILRKIAPFEYYSQSDLTMMEF